jgi:hypothetical protein
MALALLRPMRASHHAHLTAAPRPV